MANSRQTHAGMRVSESAAVRPELALVSVALEPSQDIVNLGNEV